jgi:hypothetical protein
LKVKTVIEDRFPVKKIKSVDRVIWAFSLVAETGINTMLPFAFGFYFAKTGNLIFMFLFLINVLFHIKITRKGRGIELRITRGI